MSRPGDSGPSEDDSRTGTVDPEAVRAVAAWWDAAPLDGARLGALIAALYRAAGRPESGVGSLHEARAAFDVAGDRVESDRAPLAALAGPVIPRLSGLAAARLLSRCPRPARPEQGRSRRGAHGGVVYTPRAVGAALASALPGGPGATTGPILDPAAGQGALLLALLESCPPADRPALAARMRASDVDPRSVQVLRHVLSLCGAGAPEDLVRRVRCHDPLSDPRPPRGTFGEYGLIVTNPPWVSFSGRHRDRATGASPELLRERFESCGAGAWPSLHGAFLERCAELLTADGVLLALLPAAVLELDGYGPMRRAVTRRLGPPVEARVLGEDAFPGVRLPAALLVFAAAAGRRRASKSPWPAAPDEASRARLAALASRPRFAPEVFGDPGVHTGNAAKLVLTTVEDGTPVYEGRCVRAFELREPVRGLRLDAELPAGRRWRVGPLARYRQASILIRQTADRPIAARHEPARRFRNSILACFGDPELPVEVLLAILNSELIALWHRARHGDARQRTFPQVKVGHLRNLPRPDPTRLGLVDSEGAGETLGEAIGRRVRGLESVLAGGDPGSSSDAAVSGSGDAEELRAELEARVRRLYGLDA